MIEGLTYGFVVRGVFFGPVGMDYSLNRQRTSKGFSPSPLSLAGLILVVSAAFLRGGPLETWELRHPLPTTDSLNLVSLLNGRFYAFGFSAGRSASIFTSSDGTNWDGTWRGANLPLYSAAYGNGRFVAVGGSPNSFNPDGLVVISIDGLTWTDVSSPDVPGLASIAYGAGTFVAVGDVSNVWTSSDGLQWSKGSIPGAGHLTAVAYGGGRFLAVGAWQAREVFSSKDGTNWTALLRNNDSGFNFIVAGPDRYLMGSSGPQYVFIFSADGSWQLIPTTPAVYGSMAYGPNEYLGLTYDGSATRSVYKSLDGMTWTMSAAFPQLAPGEDATISSLTFGNGVWVGVGANGLVTTSSDGVHWAFPNSITRMALRDLCEGDGLLVAVGGLQQQFRTDPTASAILTSGDGVRWSKQGVPSDRLLTSIAHGNGRFVSVGGDPKIAGSGTILVSTNGTNWASVEVNQGIVLRKVLFANGLFAVIGTDGDSIYAPPKRTVLMSSTDGVNWTTRAAATNQTYSELVYGAGRFVMTDEADWDDLYSSTNLVNWEAPLIRDTYGITTAGLCFANGIFRAAGRNPPSTSAPDSWGVYVSTDGIHWSFVRTIEPQPSLVIAVPGRFLGLRSELDASSNSVKSFVQSSTDGVHWDSRDPGVPLNGLFYSRKSIFVVGNQGAILQSGRVVPWLGSPRSTANGDGTWTINVASDPGDRVSVESSTDLMDWTSIGIVTNADSTVGFTDKKTSTANGRFYRARLLP